MRRSRASRVPAWAKVSIVAFIAVELCLLAALRVGSGLADVHAVQEIGSDLSVGTASAACTEGLAAVDDFWPAVPLLNLGRVLPSATARAWGQVPLLVDVARQACPAVQAYARVTPALDRSLADGVAADLLTSVRLDRAQLAQANQQLGDALTHLDRVDIDSLAGDPRLARVGRLLEAARAQESDVSDGLAVAAPESLEALLGGSGPRSIVLSAPGGQAYTVLDQGTVVKIGVDEPEVQPALVVSVDRAGLDELRAALTRAQVPSDAPDDVIAEALLAQIVRQSLNDNTNPASVLKHSAEDHHAWMWFEDPALQQLVARRGWIAP